MFPFLSSLNFRLIGAVLAVLAVFGTFKYVQHLRHNISDLEQAKTELTVKLNTQNAAILQMKTDADAREASHKTELAQAAQALEDAKKKATVVYYKAKPSTPTDTCKSALDLINGGGQ